MKNVEIVKEFLVRNQGYITTADFIKLGISKALIPDFIKLGLIRKVKYGMYIDNNIIEDEFFILQKKYPNIIFSHLTALEILKLTKNNNEIEVTIKRKEKIRADCKVHYITDKHYELGCITITDVFKNPIRIYNAERSLCDILKSKDKIDSKLKNQILKNYFSKPEKDLDTLIEYAKIFHIEEKVKTIIEIMTNLE